MGSNKNNKMPINPFQAFYFLCFLILSIIFIVQIVNFIKTYLEYPTYTETHLVRQYFADFPSMSICVVTGGFNQEKLLVML